MRPANRSRRSDQEALKVVSRVCLLILLPAFAVVPASAQLEGDTLVGVIDFHAHAGPTLDHAR